MLSCIQSFGRQFVAGLGGRRALIGFSGACALMMSGAAALAEPRLHQSNLPQKGAPIGLSVSGNRGIDCSGDGADLLVPFDSSDGTWTNTFSPFTPSGRNDDGSIGPIDLPFTFTVYGVEYTQVFVNNNGNLTFGEPYSFYSASGFPDASLPTMVAPFWADVDTRSTAAGGVVWHKFIGANTLVVTWDNVGHYNQSTNRLNTFQVVITDGTSELVGIGQNVGFSYSDMCWTTGDFSGGVDGFGGIPATVGVNAGDGTNFFQVGRFNRNNADYDGPFGDNDGIDFLDLQRFFVDVSETNIPPIPTGFPDGNVFVIDIDAGETLDTTVSFLSPEAGQVTDVEILDVDGLMDLGLTSTVTPGETATVDLQWAPGCCDQGTYALTFIATDDADGVTTVNATVEVRCGNGIPIADAGGPYVLECQGSDTSGLLSGLGSVDPDPNPVPLTYFWSSDCPGVVFDDPTSATPLLTVDSSLLSGLDCELLCSVTVTVSDGVCEDSATSALRVEDNLPPDITPPSPINAVAEVFNGGLSAAVQVDPPAVSDDCTPNPTLGGVRDDGLQLNDRYPVGTTTITWTATDACQLASQQTQAIIVAEPPLPDLIVEAITLPAGASEGDTITAEFTVRNTGTADATGAWTDVIRLSDDDTIGSDTFAAEIGFSGTLAAGATYTRQAPVTLPNGVFGDLYAVCETDAGGDLFERLNESPNTAISAAPVTIHRPDLAVASVNAPPQVFIGQSVSVSWGVQNNSADGAARRAWSDRLVFSIDAVLGNADDTTLIDAPAASTLEPGASYLNSASGDIPRSMDIPLGQAFLFVLADAGNAQPETDENNNASAPIPVDVALPPTPDLRVTILDAPSSSVVGELIEVAFEITNAGDGPASAIWDDSIVLSTTPDPSGSVATLGAFSAPLMLGPGESYQRTESVRVPGNAGQFFVIVRADVQNTIDELFNEDNNSDAAAIELEDTPIPDLVVTDVTPPADGVLSGQVTQVSWIVTNQGTGATSAQQWTDTVFLSQDPDLVFSGPGGDQTICNQAELNNAIPVIRVTNPQFLAAGESYVQTAQYTLPPDIQGPYFVYVITDRGGCHDIGGRVAEVSNTNNISRSEAFSIELSPQPDLVVTALIAPSTGASGNPIDVTWRTLNQGAATTSSGNWTDRVYLSLDSDPVISQADQQIAQSSRSGAPLGIGEQTDPRTVSATLPPIASGEHFVKVFTDANNAVPEIGSEGNNVSVSGPLDIVQSVTPDLVVLSTAADTIGALGHEITVEYTVTNIGGPPLIAGSWNDSAYLSADQSLDPGVDIPLGSGGSSTTSGMSGLVINEYTRTIAGRVPNDLAPGDYYVLVMADQGDTLAEVGGEDNNLGVTASAITIESRPADLAINPDAGGTTVAGPVGVPLTLAWSVSNTGVERTPVSVWRDRVLLSQDASPSMDDVVLGTVQRNGSLDAGASYDASFETTVPDAAPGSYFLIFQTDSADEVFEDGDDGLDNAATMPFEINPSGIDFFADLVPQSDNFPSQLDEGATYTASWTVQNVGGAPTPDKAWADRVVLSADTTADFGDTPLAFVGVTPPLGSGASYTESAQITLPAGQTGQYYLILVVDGFNSIAEFDESNNNIVSPLTINGPPPPRPNLIAHDASISSSGVSGDSVEVSFIIENTSGVDAVGDWRNSAFLSSTPGLNGSERLLGSVSQSDLAAGQSLLFSQPFALPLDLPAGEYHLVVVADSNRRVNEGAFEGDNTSASSSTITVTEPPRADLAVASVTPPSAGVSGQSVDVSWTVENVGAGDTRAASRQDRVYLSRDRFFSSVSDVLLGSANSAATIPSGGSEPASSSFELPLGVSGSYYVIVHTDALDAEIEPAGDATNIAASSTAFDVQLPEASDLVVESVTAPAVATIGEPATFMWTTRNDGESSASGRWDDRVFLSADEEWDISDPVIATHRVPQTTLAQGETADFQVEAVVPPVLPGNYFVIVRADTRNQIPETDESNNANASASTVSVTVPLLVLGVPEAVTLPNGRELTYQLDAPAGETIDINLTHSAPSAWTELFVAYERVPTIGDFDFAFAAPAEASQTIRIPVSQGGSYYVLARATANVPSGMESATLRADALPFGVESVSPETVGRARRVTLEITGSRFRTGSRVFLEPPGGGSAGIEAIGVDPSGGDTIVAGFQLDEAALGVYDLVVLDPLGSEARLGNAVTIAPAQTPVASVEILGPSRIRVGSSAVWTVRVTNLSNVDIAHALVHFSVFDDGDTSIEPAEQQFLDINGEQIPLPAQNSYVDPVQGAVFQTFFVTGLRSGAFEDLDIRVNVGANSTDGPLGNGAFVEVLSADEFVSGTILPSAEALRQIVLNDFDSYLHYTGDPEVDAVIDDIRLALTTVAPDPMLFTDLYAQFYADNNVLNLFYDGEAIDSAGINVTSAQPRISSSSYFGSLACAAAILGTGIAIGTFTGGLGLGAAIAVAGGLGIAGTCGPLLFPPDPPPCGCCNSGGGTQGVYGEPPDDLGQVVLLSSDGTPYSPPLASVRDDSGGTCGGGSKDKPEDPNEKRGPFGFDEGFVPAAPIPYQVFFENLPEVQANAAVVQVVDQIDPNLSTGSFRLGDIQFGDYVVDVPEGRNFFQTVIDLTDDPDRNCLLRVTAGLDAVNREAFWRFESIDPDTGEVPSDPLRGFLPPNVDSPEGEGHVEFFIAPAFGVTSGDRITNEATIIFDTQDDITTNAVVLTVDPDAPFSSVTPTPLAIAPEEGGSNATASFPLTWSGGDVPGGSGLAGFSVYVSTDGGPPTPLAIDTLDQSGTVVAQAGSVYSFYSVATDHAGNVEDVPGEADAVTVVPIVELDPASDTGEPGDGETTDTTPTINFVSIPNETVSLVFDGPSPLSTAVDTDELGRGSYTVADPDALTPGVYTVSTDNAGVAASTSFEIISPPVAVSGWSSFATHGPVGGVALEIDGDTGLVEPRAPGVGSLSIAFSGGVDPATLSPSSVLVNGLDTAGNPVDLSGISIGVTVGPDNESAGISFTPALPDAARYCVTLVDVLDPSGHPLDGAARVNITALQGDVTGDGRVNASDLAFIRDIRNQLDGGLIDPDEQVEIRADVSADGRVNATDLAFTRASNGIDTRAIIDPCGEITATGGDNTAGGGNIPGSRAIRGGRSVTASATDTGPLSGDPRAWVPIRSGFTPADVTIRHDPHSFVVRAEDGAPESMAALARLGLESGASRFGYRDWLLVQVPDASSASSHRARLGDLGLPTSPVYRDDADGILVPTPAVLVEFEAGIDDAARAQALLSALNSETGVSQIDPILPRVARVVFTGLASDHVVEAADRLAQLPQVRHAEPDFVISASRVVGMVNSPVDAELLTGLAQPPVTLELRPDNTGLVLIDDGLVARRGVLGGRSVLEGVGRNGHPETAADTFGELFYTSFTRSLRGWGAQVPTITPLRAFESVNEAGRSLTSVGELATALTAADGYAPRMIVMMPQIGYRSSMIEELIARRSSERVVLVPGGVAGRALSTDAEGVLLLDPGKPGDESVPARGAERYTEESGRVAAFWFALQQVGENPDARVLSAVSDALSGTPLQDHPAIRAALAGAIREATDLNDDGAVDEADIALFVDAFNTGRPAADTNGDGELTGRDLLDFVTRYDQLRQEGCNCRAGDE